jgi:prepilin-type N-terminal cleavage/methylation domain-containing protein
MNHKNAFTLIELMVVITIMGIIMFASYIPYQYHQKKTALKLAAREVSQSLSEARNLALHGLDTGSGNLSLWLLFASGANQITYYAYPFEQSMDLLSMDESYKFKEKKLPRGVIFHSIGGEKQDYFISFDAITGSGSITDTTLPIVLSYAWSDDIVLQKNILYYTRTHISDY